MLLGSLAGCSPRGSTAAVEPHRSTRAIHAADASEMLSAMRLIAGTRDRARAAWPGFDPGAQVLLAVLEPSGPVFVLGDERPPDLYRWVDRHALIAARTGPPPDSLRGLRLAFTWNGREQSATGVTFTSTSPAQIIPHFLVHEAFHTYQRQAHAHDARRFVLRGNPVFPTWSVDAVGLLNLEGAYLAAAIQEPVAQAARSLAISALAVRAARCQALGTEECANERGIEHAEGTASYVTARTLGVALGYGGPAMWRDSMARSLSPIVDPRRLERWHFYDTGHAWLLLLQRFGPPGWEQEAEWHAPDQVLASTLAFDARTVDSLVALARGSARGRTAMASATAAVAQMQAARDSAARAFADRPGVPVRIYFGPVRRISEATSVRPDGILETVIEFDGNRVVLHGPVRDVCCPGRMTVARVAGREAHANGQRVPLDEPGMVTGSLEVRLPELELRMLRAELRVFRDSVTISVLPPAPPSPR